MTENYLIGCVAHSGSGCELVKALRKYIPIKSFYLAPDPYGLDIIDSEATITMSDFPKEGNKLIIVTAYVYKYLSDLYGIDYFKNFNEVTIIVVDSTYLNDIERYNSEWVGFNIFCETSKIQYRGDSPTKEYVQPLDMSYFYKSKNKALTIGHSPFSKIKELEKGTDYFTEIMKDINCDFRIIQGLRWQRAMQEKGKCHVFIDQIIIDKSLITTCTLPENYTGGIGMSGLEAMNLRCCTMSSGEFVGREIPAPPLVWITKDNFLSRLYEVVANIKVRKEYADRQFEWAQIYTNPDYQARRILNII